MEYHRGHYRKYRGLKLLKFLLYVALRHNLNIMGAKEACDLLNAGPQRLSVLIKKYDIPHCELATGNIFLKEDLEAFQKSREKYMKHHYGKKNWK